MYKYKQKNSFKKLNIPKIFLLNKVRDCLVFKSRVNLNSKILNIGLKIMKNHYFKVLL